MTDNAIFLKKGMWVVHVVSVMLAPPEEAPSEQAEGTQALKEWMTVQERQEKLLEKLNLDGLSEWSPRNAAIVRELLLSYHDTFALKSDELGCTSTIKHEIQLNDDEPFKEHFRCIPPPLLEEVHASLRDMLEAGTIRPSQSRWCNAMVLVPPQDTRGTGEHGWSCTLLHYGLQEWILAGLHGPGVAAVYCIHGQQLGFLRIHKNALWIVQCTCNVPVSYAEHTGRVELDLLCHLPGWCDSIWSHRRTSWASTDSIGAFPRVQPETETLQVFLLPGRDSVPRTSCCQGRNSPKPGEHMHHHGVSHARNLHQSKIILWVVRSSPMLYQKLCMFGPCTVWPTRWWNQNGTSDTYTWGGGGGVSVEGENHQYWCSQTSASLSCWKPIHPKRDLVWCSHKSRMTGATTLQCLAAERQRHLSKTITALNWNSSCWSEALLNTSRNIWPMLCLWCVQTTNP